MENYFLTKMLSKRINEDNLIVWKIIHVGNFDLYFCFFLFVETKGANSKIQMLSLQGNIILIIIFVKNE